MPKSVRGSITPIGRFALLCVCCALIAAVLPAADEPAATTVMGHRMGETFQEWLSVSHYDLPTLCSDRKQKQNCKLFTAIQSAGGNGRFLMPGAFAGSGAPAGCGILCEWEFAGGKLAQLKVTLSLTQLDPSVDQQFGFLTERYGSPTHTSTVVYQNGFGAKFDCREALWIMPDGAAILAQEKMERGNSHILTVLFQSKEKAPVLGQGPKNPW